MDETLPSCPECGALVSSVAGDVSVNSSSARKEPSDHATPHDPPPPPADSEKQKDLASHPYEERLKALEQSIVGWINKNRRLSLLLSVLSLAIGIAGLWFVAEFFKGRKSPPPDAVFIEVEKNATWVEAGGQLKLTARISPVENIPGEFRWGPADMIEGNGQSVVFKPPKDGRQTAYPQTVTLTTFDRLGNHGPTASRLIDVLPEGQTNHKPELEEGVHIEGSPEVQSGTSVNLDALARDEDKDKLDYNWSVLSRLVQIEGNGNRRVTLKLPRDLARRANVLLAVKLVVSDGKGGTVSDLATLTVTPQGHLRISRTKRSGDQKAIPQQPTATQPAKANSSSPLAAPQATQSGAKPDQVTRP